MSFQCVSPRVVAKTQKRDTSPDQVRNIGAGIYIADQTIHVTRSLKRRGRQKAEYFPTNEHDDEIVSLEEVLFPMCEVRAGRGTTRLNADCQYVVARGTDGDGPAWSPYPEDRQDAWSPTRTNATSHDDKTARRRRCFWRCFVEDIYIYIFLMG